MTTPEGVVKDKLRKMLGKYQGIYTYWPVPSGYGHTTIDCIGCYRGRFFAVETKALKKKPTLRQQIELNKMDAAMGRTFVIAGKDSPVFGELADWLETLKQEIVDDPHISPDQVDRAAV